jgi:hypothetical protein
LVESRFAWPRIGKDMADVYDWIVGGAKPMSVRRSGNVGGPSGLSRPLAANY